VALDVLVGYATLAATSSPGESKRERAVNRLAHVLQNPASEFETKEKAGRLLAELAAELSQEIVAGAQKKGESESLEQMIAEAIMSS
jgi:hypothetical protein